MNPQNRESALAQIQSLMREFDIEMRDIERVEGDNDGSRRSALLVKMLSYIGGAFVFSGIAAFIAMQWPGMNSLARVIVSLGSGLTLFVLALTALADARYRMAVIGLLLGAAVLEPTGIMVALHEFGSGGDAQVAALLTAATVALQFLLVFMRYRLATMLAIALFFASAAWGLLLDLWEFDWSLIAISSGAAWLLLGLQVHRGAYRLIGPPLFFFGCWAFLAGLFDIVEASAVELSFMLAACGMTYLGIWARSRALNFASTVAILAYTAYFTGTHFADSIGWPIALILIGLLMIGIGSLALRIDRTYLRGRAS